MTQVERTAAVHAAALRFCACLRLALFVIAAPADAAAVAGREAIPEAGTAPASATTASAAGDGDTPATDVGTDSAADTAAGSEAASAAGTKAAVAGMASGSDAASGSKGGAAAVAAVAAAATSVAGIGSSALAARLGAAVSWRAAACLATALSVTHIVKHMQPLSACVVIDHEEKEDCRVFQAVLQQIMQTGLMSPGLAECARIAPKVTQ